MIDYARLGRSISHYEVLGYNRIEVPWTVTQAVSDLTKPPHANDFVISNKKKVLVASAEQGFLYLALKGFLAPGKYQSVTPCFRDESFDVTHTKYFLKNELFITCMPPTIKSVREVVSCAFSFFRAENRNGDLAVIVTEDGYDIELNGIEIGSYGLRKTSFVSWIYGTGLAEPRFTAASNL